MVFAAVAVLKIEVDTIQVMTIKDKGRVDIGGVKPQRNDVRDP